MTGDRDSRVDCTEGGDGGGGVAGDDDAAGDNHLGGLRDTVDLDLRQSKGQDACSDVARGNCALDSEYCLQRDRVRQPWVNGDGR